MAGFGVYLGSFSMVGDIQGDTIIGPLYLDRYGRAGGEYLRELSTSCLTARVTKRRSRATGGSRSWQSAPWRSSLLVRIEATTSRTI